MAVYKDMASFQKKLKKWEKDYPNDVFNAMRIAGEMVRTETLTKHLNGMKMPKGVGSDRNATLGINTGKLRNSIMKKVNRTASGIKTFVGTFINPVKYARYHEEGTSIHPKRPFLKPSLQAKRKAIVKLLQERMMESYKNA